MAPASVNLALILSDPRSPVDRGGTLAFTRSFFADNTPLQLAAQTPALTGDVASGYRGSVVIGVKGRDGAPT
jgi:hypothetical protein